MEHLKELTSKLRNASRWTYFLAPLFILPLIVIPLLKPVWENDIFLHNQMGKEILAHHRLGGNPNWLYGSATQDKGWVTTMMVPEVLMYLIYHFLGLIGFTVIELLAGLALIPIMFFSINHLAPKPLSIGSIRVGATVGSLLIVLYSFYITPRPQMISLLIFPVVCLWLIKMATDGVAPKLIPATLLVMIWSWFHGYSLLVAPLLFVAALSYILGTYLTEKLFGGELTRKALTQILDQWKIFIFLAFAPLVNPIGYKYWVASLHIRRASINIVSEWKTPSLNDKNLLMILSIMALWLAVALYHWFSINKVEIPLIIKQKILLSFTREALLIIGSTIVLIQSRRTALLLFLLLSLILIRRAMLAFNDSGEKTSDRWKSGNSKRLAYSLTILIVSALILTSTLGASSLGKLSEDKVPLRIYSAMNKVPGEHRVLISYNISSTLIPYVSNARVSIDGRIDKFGPSGAYGYFACITNGIGCVKMLKFYSDSTDAVLNSNDRVVSILESRGWKIRLMVKSGAINYLWLKAPKQNW